MDIKVKKLDKNAVIPKYAKLGDAGLDLTATSIDHTDTYIEYGTGLAFEIPQGYVGLVFPRSSISKTGLSLSNSVGVIDSGYRGEIKFRFRLTNDQRVWYSVGDRVGQIIIMPYPSINLTEVDELSSSDRSSGGFGSTGE